jgi:hypothetical protein
VLPQRAATKETPGVVGFEENTLPVMSAAAVMGGMSFLSLRQLAVIACSCASSVSLLWAVLVQVSAPAPQTAGRLFAVSPDVAQLLAVVAFGKSILDFIILHPDGNVAEAWQTESFLVLCRPRQGYEEQGKVYDFGPFAR